MNKRVTITLGVIVALAFITLYVFIQAQEPQEVTIRYKLDVGDIWEYECVAESETDYTHNETEEKHFRYIKENFRYEVMETTPEGYFKVKLSTIPVESKGVSIIAGKRSEMHNFIAGHEYEETFVDLQGEVMTMSYKSAGFISRPGGVITMPLVGTYENMIRYLHPVMPEEMVGINDTWNYTIASVPDNTPGMEILALLVPTLITYTVVAFEEKNGFDCVKIAYNYNTDYTDKIMEEYAQAEGMENFSSELRIKGTGTIYFAYNEGFVVSRKENLMRTDIENQLINDEWKLQNKYIERIGFTMNYKP